MIKEKIIAVFKKYEVPEEFFIEWCAIWQNHFAKFRIPMDCPQEVLTEEQYLDNFLKSAKERRFHAPW